MASIEPRSGVHGGYFRVVWREAGIKQTEKLRTRGAAEKFAALVEAHNNRWPPGWVKGRGFENAPDTDAVTFEQFARATITARSTANPRTRADYLRDLERHVFPTFGDSPVDGIGRRQVGAWVIELRDGGMQAKTIKNIQGLSSSVLADAIVAGLATANPFKGSMGTLPNARQEEMCFLTRAEFDLLLSFISEHYRALTQTLALTGLRWSEATALGVRAVDLSMRRLTVTRAWKRTPDNHQELGEPKSRRSRRTIGIPPNLATVLEPLVAGQDPSGFVFTTKQGRPVRHNNYWSKVWQPAVAKARETGMDKQPRIHDLRHSHASWLIAAGVPLPAIQRRLGHESITTTIDRYGHLAPELDDAISAALDDPTPEP